MRVEIVDGNSKSPLAILTDWFGLRQRVAIVVNERWVLLGKGTIPIGSDLDTLLNRHACKNGSSN